MWRRIFTFLAAMALLWTLGSCTQPKHESNTNVPTARAATTEDPVIVAAGDIACDPDSAYFYGNNPKYCQDEATADRVRAINPDKVIALGDTQYTEGTDEQYAKSYSRSWGKDDIKSKTLAVVGNHEYRTKNAQGYRNFFGDPGARDLAYSYKVNDNWRIFVLNSNCSELAKPGVAGSCSGQTDWMKTTMADSPTKCTIAAFHHPRRTDVSVHYPGSTAVSGFEQGFYDRRGEIILNGHAHSVEISNKITPSGSNSSRGTKHFTIGSGGKESGLAWEHSTKPSWTDYRVNNEHAVLKLTLHSSSYDYELVDIDGNVLRSGTRDCF